jgi:hypothetical protein
MTGQMDDLTAQLEAVLLRHARAHDPRIDPAVFEQSMKQLHKDMRVLVAEFGQAAVDAALNDIPEKSWPSASLH